jgi:hypothetical protein
MLSQLHRFYGIKSKDSLIAVITFHTYLACMNKNTGIKVNASQAFLRLWGVTGAMLCTTQSYNSEDRQ